MSYPLENMADRFVNFCDRFGDHFKTQTRSCEAQAQQYLKGLVQAEDSNMERMEEVVPDSNEQALQNFISNSKWSADAVLEQVGAEADSLLGDEQNACLIIDESGIPKKGVKSVGVGRQWCGQLGKVEN